MLAHKISKIELKHCHSRQDRMYGSRILILGSLKRAVIREKCKEPNSYMVEIPATGQCFRRNSNFIKPRQTDKNSVSTDPLPTTGLPEIPQEPPVLQQPSSQVTSTVDAIPTVPPSKQNDNSTPRTPRTPRQPRASRRSTKGIPPPRLGLQE